MLAQAAAQLGLHVAIYCPEENPPGAEVAQQHFCGAYEDHGKLAEFANAVDRITYEFENIPVETVQFLAQSKPVWPNVKALEVSQDRLREKQFMQSLDIPVAPFYAINDRAALDSALAALDGHGILKTRRMGYDGKGQWRLSPSTDCNQVWAEAAGQELILEGIVPFSHELSVIIARSEDGAQALYDPAHNVHQNHILHTSTVPAPLSALASESAGSIGKKISSELGYVGILAVELFMTDAGFVVNEIAPRVHNSGHWTLDACMTDQFTQHIRAIAGWPLASAKRHSDAIMTNLIGDDVDNWQAIIASPQNCLHLYGKSDVKPGRKMGHVTELLPLSTEI